MSGRAVADAGGAVVTAPSSRHSLAARFRSRFGRRTSSGRFIAEIDGLRFPAIAFVVLGHLCSFVTTLHAAPDVSTSGRIVRSISDHASEGVVLFFIVSGFVLALPFASEQLLGARPVSLRAYFLRRVTRLEPPYLLSLAVFLVAKLLARRLHLVPGTESAGELMRHFAASAGYLHNLVYGEPSLINGVAWSLEVEIQFYLLVPLLAAVFRIRSTLVRRAMMLAAIVAMITAQYVPLVLPPRVSLSILGNLQFFLLGFLLADVYLLDPALSARERGWGWDIVAIVAWWLVMALWNAGDAAAIALPFVAFAAFVAVFRGVLANRLFTNPWITTIGGMCYSIYLLHFMLITMAGKLLYRGRAPSAHLWSDLLMRGPVLLAIAMVVSAVFFALVERPCMDPQWPEKLARRLRLGREPGATPLLSSTVEEP